MGACPPCLQEAHTAEGRQLPSFLGVRGHQREAISPQFADQNDLRIIGTPPRLEVPPRESTGRPDIPLDLLGGQGPPGIHSPGQGASPRLFFRTCNALPAPAPAQASAGWPRVPMAQCLAQPCTLVRYLTTGSTRPESVLLATMELTSKCRRVWAGRLCRVWDRAVVPRML